MIRLVIVDDQPAFRIGMRSLLTLENDLNVVGEAGDGNEAVLLLRRVAADVVLMDLRMPRLDGISAIRIIRQRDSKICILALTTFNEDALVEQSIHAGANGYVLKNTPSEDLARVIRLTHLGYLTFSKETVHSLARKDDAKISEASLLAIAALPKTSRAVLRCLGLGMTNAKIAQTLNITEGTVKNYVSEILEVMEFRNRLEAGIFAHCARIPIEKL